jgi:aminoglycoside 3-N-acetyltransferase
MTELWDYTKNEFIQSLENIGIVKGDTIFTHVGYGLLGKPKDCITNNQICKMILDSFLSVLGNKGTLLVPTYTYSFCENQIFDIKNTHSTIGPFTEFVRVQNNILRSKDPIFSVVGIGPKKEQFLEKLPHTCFGIDCVYDRLKKEHGKICMVGIGLQWATFRHHIEEMANIPSRFIKKFNGKILENGKYQNQQWSYYVRHLNKNCLPDGKKLEKKVRDENMCKISKIGRGEIVVINSNDYFDFGFKNLKKDPWLTSKGPPTKIM